jgi:hypothetical protein
MPKGRLVAAAENPVAAKIRAAIGAGPSEPVEVMTPQFTRPAGEPGPASPPADLAAFVALATLPDTALKELGLRRWGRQHEHADGSETGPMLWLFPGEWYSAIPEGLPIVDINFNAERFRLGQTDDDIRFGCLSFGILLPVADGSAS